MSIVSETKQQTNMYIRSGIIVMGALAWNDLIGEILERVYPRDSKELIAKFIYAIALTIIIVTLLRYI